MKIIAKIVLCISVLALLVSCSAQESAPKVEYLEWITWTQEELEASKKNIEVDGHLAQQAYAKLISDADKSLSVAPMSVMDKTLVAESGDKRDYLSLSTYWWPNPDSADGLPYIRKDGETNPETQSDATDKRAFSTMAGAVYNLGLAYYFSGEEKYAEKAAELVKVWFLNEATAMNPNFEHGQSVRGVSHGRVYGLIEACNMIKIIDCMLLLQHNNSPSWTEADMVALRGWFSDFVDWAFTSDIGIGEMHSYNNHGIWMDAQMTTYLLFTGQVERAKEQLNLALRRERSVFAADGHQPEEAARTRAYSYHCFALGAWAHLIRYGQRIDYPIQYRNLLITYSRNIRGGVKFMLPYIAKEKVWPFYEIRGIDAEYYRATIFLPHIRSAFVVEDVKKYVRPGDPVEITAEDPEITALTGKMETIGIPNINEVTQKLFEEFPTYKEVLLYPII